MAYQLRARCDSCDYEEPGLVIGDGERYLGFCAPCGRAINPFKSRWRPLDPLTCPHCRRLLDQKDLVFNPTLDSADYQCPVCKEPSLRFEPQMHMSLVPPRLEEGLELQALGLGYSDGEAIAVVHPHFLLKVSEPPDPFILHYFEATVTRVGSYGEPGSARGGQLLAEARTRHCRELIFRLDGQPWLKFNLVALLADLSRDALEHWPKFEKLTRALDPQGETAFAEATVQDEDNGPMRGWDFSGLWGTLYEYGSRGVHLEGVADGETWGPVEECHFELDFGKAQPLILSGAWGASPDGPEWLDHLLNPSQPPRLDKVIIRCRDRVLWSIDTGIVDWDI